MNTQETNHRVSFMEPLVIINDQSCKNATKCRIGHKCRHIHIPKRQICINYTTAGCSSGKSCWFVHPEFCKDYKYTGKCRFGKKCRYVHLPNKQKPPCGHYIQTGRCRFGKSCRFEHSYIDQILSLTEF
jgi:hypothetical protein